MQKCKLVLQTPLLLTLLTLALLFPTATLGNKLSVEDFFKNPEFRSLSLSPDGKHLAAIVPVGDRRNLAVMDIKTREAKAITSLKKTDIAGYSWANDKRLVFYLDDDGNESIAMFAVNVDGSKSRELAANESGISLSPRYTRMLDRLKEIDDEVLVISNKRRSYAPDVYRMNIHNGRMKRLTTNDGNIQDWLPDQHGKVLGAVSADENLHTKILYRPTEDSKWETLTEYDWLDHGWTPLEFSHDGNTLYVASNIGRDTMGIYAYDLKARKLGEALFTSDEVDVGNIYLSDVSEAPILSAYETDKLKTHFYDTEFKSLQSEIDKALPPGTINSIVSLSEDEQKILYLSWSDKVNGSYYLFDREKKSLEKLLDTADWLNPAVMADIKPIKYKARDGEIIHGYLTVPKDTEAKNLPLIVNPHGGPYGPRDSWGFNTEIQFLASRGYAVLQMNYRGSGGYGKRFSDIAWKKWGLEMQDDITDGVKWAIDEGIANKDRVCIYGGSYGGYATMAGITQTPELYKCAINYVGVADLEMLVDYDIEDEDRGGHVLAGWVKKAIGDPKNPADKKRLAATSPINHVDKIKVPLLIVHGVRDRRVEIKQARDLMKALDKRDIPYQKLIKRREGHGFQKEENRIELYTLMEKFLAENL